MSFLNPNFSVSRVNTNIPIKFAAPGQDTTSVFVGVFADKAAGSFPAINSSDASYQYAVNFVSNAAASYNTGNQATFPHMDGLVSGINIKLSA